MALTSRLRMAVAVLALITPMAATVSVQTSKRGVEGGGDLVFMHMPYNFGHTVEKVALFREGASLFEVGSFLFKVLGGFGSNKGSNTEAMWRQVNMRRKKGGVAWGHMNPDLSKVLPGTGCSMYFSPQKFWPKDVAAQYFGNRTVFGMLRDPYERLVAMFRGSAQITAFKQDYGNIFNKKYVDKCDVNRAIKDALKSYIASGEYFQSGCTFVPQADYFEGEYGITLPVDNRLFPDSMNKVFQEHHYSEHITRDDIFHVGGCKEVWAADLDSETRALVQQVYKRDFELLCKHFNYCDVNENTCIHGVPDMCPKSQCQGGRCAQ